MILKLKEYVMKFLKKNDKNTTTNQQASIPKNSNNNINNNFNTRLYCPDLGRTFGANFKEYFITENMPERISNLKMDLDDKSIATIDYKIQGFLNLPLQGSDYMKHCRFDTRTILYNKEALRENEEFIKDLPKLKEKYIIEDFCMRPETFFYHHGLKFLTKKEFNYIENKIFVDCGAYHAESCIIFSEYNPSMIYAFEIIPESKKIFYKNLEINKIKKNKIKFVNKGISNKKYSMKINNITGHYESIGSKYDEKGKSIEIVPLDNYLLEHKKDIGLIKMDIEGAEYDAILGAKDIILQSKPILLISIYHTPKQFFELKPLIREMTDDSYKFLIRDLNAYNSNCNETTLICVPKNII